MAFMNTNPMTQGSDYDYHEPTAEIPFSYSSYRPAVNKSSQDNRDFRVIVLENQLEVMLINDSEATSACVALNLLAGSGVDHPHLHGLANLTQKWLLRASKRYPTDGQFESFIKEHGGVLYSHTTLKTGEISFGLQVDYLQDSLVQFASVLTEPLFQRQVAEKVVQGIQDEHSKFLKQENMGIKLLVRNFFRPPNKMTHFDTGNRETLLINPPKLGIDIHREVKQYYDTYYSSNLMKLVILGNQGLSTLTEWAVTTFSGIPNKIIPVPQLERVALPVDYSRQVLVKSQQHTRSLIFLFPLFCHGSAAGSVVGADDAGSVTRGHTPADSGSESDRLPKLNASLADLKLHDPSQEYDTMWSGHSRRSSLSNNSVQSQGSNQTASTGLSSPSVQSGGGFPMMPMGMMMGPNGAPMPMNMAAMYQMNQWMMAMNWNMYSMFNGNASANGTNTYGPPPMPYGQPGMNQNFPSGNAFPGQMNFNNPSSTSVAHSQASAQFNGLPTPPGMSYPLPGQTPLESGYHPNTPQLDIHREWAPALAYVRHLLELRTPGSVVHYLNKKGWATYIHTKDIHDFDCDTPFFKMTVSLTKAGFEAYEEVIQAVFEYFSMIRRAGIQQWLYDEIRSIAAIKFFTRAKFNDFDCPRFADTMIRTDLAPDHYLSDQAMSYQCIEEHIQHTLDCLNPKNFSVVVVSRDIQSPGMSKEKYYRTRYQVTSLPLTLQMALTDIKRCDKFHLPSKNPYLLECLDTPVKMTPLDPTVRMISDGPHSRCWFLHSNNFTPARTDIRIALQSPLAFKTAASYVRTKLMTKLLQEKCKRSISSTSAAGAAHMFHTIEAGPDGIQGFSEKQDLMLTKVFSALNSLKVEPYSLKFYSDELLLDFQCDASNNDDSPDAFLTNLFGGYNWPRELLMRELKSITVNDMSEFVSNYLNRVYLEVLVTGNATESEVLDILRMSESQLRRSPVLKTERYCNRSLHLPLGSRYVYRLKHHSSSPDSRVAYFVQAGENSKASLRVYQDVIAYVVENKCIPYFQTQMGLENITCEVLCKPNRPLGLFLMASGEKDPGFLESGIELCLQMVRRQLADMSPTELAELLGTMENQKRLQAKGVSSHHLWNRIVYHAPTIYQQEDFDILASIHKSNLMEMFKRYFDKSSRYFTKISVHVSPQNKVPLLDGQVFLQDTKALNAVLQSSEMPWST
ncbi:metalloprotease [Dispira parvispora]|uniref:Metalloprotease n=1 Tax=Dispira parvispora TaxID=1520584 RepID=A0A9W8E0F0_9FUNG|nr:metalloprotease [Dispira parvispora]